MTTVTERASSSASVPTATDLVGRVREIAPILTKNAAEGERNRRVVEESIQAMTDAGLFKLAVPKRYGGYETSMRTMLDVSAAVAESDGGTAWVLTLTNVCAWLTGLFPTRAQDEVFGADPDAKVSGVLTPTSETTRVDGGYRVTGRWYYNSGSWHATWAVLGIPITNDAGEVIDQGLALIPTSEMQLEDTWFVAGMKSSGSNCLVATDVFVPDHRVMAVPPAIEGTYPSENLADEPSTVPHSSRFSRSSWSGPSSVWGEPPCSSCRPRRTSRSPTPTSLRSPTLSPFSCKSPRPRC